MPSLVNSRPLSAILAIVTPFYILSRLLCAAEIALQAGRQAGRPGSGRVIARGVSTPDNISGRCRRLGLILYDTPM